MTAPIDQAELLRRARGRTRTPAPGTPAAGPVPRGTAPGPAPLSHAQQRMWLMDRLGQGGPRYHVPLATRLTGPLDRNALATALTGLTDRHHILRTRYGHQDDRPHQEPAPPAPVPLPVRDATPEEAAALLRAEAARPFDLAAGPALRALLLRHAPDEHTLLLTIHHIGVDGGSLPVLAEELGALYAAAAEGRPADLPEPELQYADYARWERARDDRLADAAAARAARLTGAGPLPLLRPVPPGTPERRAVLHSAPLTADTVDGLRRLGARHGATAFTVVLTAAFAALRAATGGSDLVLGCAGGHRARPELRRLIGLQVNTLPVRARLPEPDGDPAFTELLAVVRTALLDAQEHHEVPFDLVVERLGAAARGADGTPLLAVSCDLVHPAEPLTLPGLTAEAVEVDLGLAKFGLTLLVEDGPRPRCLLQHDPAALDAATAGRLHAVFADLLKAVADDADRPLSGLPGERLLDERPTDNQPTGDHHPAVAALLADPRVTDAALHLAEHGPALAYATVSGPVAPSGAELRAALRRRLADPDALPLSVTLLDRIPRRSDGALDPGRLPGAPTAHLDTVREVFAELLGTRPPAEGDFFGLGGHSLVAVQLAERLRARLGLPLTGLDVLERRTPRALAALLAERAAERGSGARRPASGTGAAPAARAGTVLLTGASGGVGAALLQELVAQGRPVRALVRPESAHLVAGAGVEVAEGDLADPDSLRRAVEGAETVIHAACTFTEHAVDLAAMRILVEGWRGTGGFVFVSSIDAYGRPEPGEVPEGGPSAGPLTPYGQAKLDCERILLDAAPSAFGPVAVVRSPIVWGPHRRLRDQLRWGATGALYQAALAGRPILLPEPGAGWAGASWVHSAALARAVTASLADAPGRIVNAVTGHVSWADFSAELVRLLGSSSTVAHGPDAEAELLRPWSYRADALAGPLAPEPGEDWRTVLAAMTALPAGTH
ncbi:condensation domain-containing protein [Kitasatospora purpeofusca]|uniref:condensation domain-containing protein n=1 Tax=Kitasatospora purpeofusca TaxID=67352 RepID=UPI00224F4428|nr:condensation domain-containing protein [Kitasatospora purpeofusca]MCX4689454.1 condensation domain-containing protein [Kitasatospora purpeofusca]